MTEPMQRCDNCLKQFPESKIATHFGYCRRNIKRCDQCGEMFDINCKEEHEEQFHKKAKCQFCQKQFGSAELEKHKSVCTQRTKFCEYCQLNVPINQFTSHLKACESRTKQCDKCKKPIANKQYLVHLTTCPGFVEEPRGYDQFIRNQRDKMQKDEFNKYSRGYNKQQQRKEVDYRRIQVPTGPTYGASNYGNSRETKPTVVPTNSRSQPTNIPGSSGGSIGTYSRGTTQISSNYGPSSINQPKKEVPVYNPRQIATNSNPTTTSNNRNPIPNTYKYDPKPQIKTQVRRAEQIPQSYGGYSGNTKPTENVRRQVIGGISGIGSGNTGIRTGVQPSNVPTTNYRNDPIQKGPSSSSNQYSNQYSNKYPSSQTTNQQSNQYRQEQPKRIQKPAFDPREYGGYQDLQRDTRNTGNKVFDEDEEMQKAIMESMGQQYTKKTVLKNLPQELQSQDLMNQSFYRDMDIEKQRAVQEQFRRNNAAKKGGRR